jgi:hypothetical protein
MKHTSTIGGATVAKIHVDVLPLKTNVTVALYHVTSTADTPARLRGTC